MFEAITIIIGLPICGGILISLAAIFFYHRRKMEELKQKQQRLIAEDIRAEFEKLRGEIRDLRDVTTQYDISFDTALQHMDHRVKQLERTPRVQQSESVHESVLRERRV